MENFTVIMGNKDRITYEKIKTAYEKSLGWLDEGEYKELVRDRYNKALKEIREALKIK